jgi:hypothetical protein
MPDSSSIAIASRLGRWAESNLGAFATLAHAEAVRSTPSDDAPLLCVGIGLLKARQDVRASLSELERRRWEARPR